MNEIPASRRQQIETAALQLFCERGFHGTSIPQLAERAGVSAGLLYRYFASKEALVNHLYRSWKAQLGQPVEELVRQQPHFRQQFRTFVEQVIAFADRHPEAFLFLETHHHAPYLDEESGQASQAGQGRVLDFLQMGVAQGFLKDLPGPLLLVLLWGPLVEYVRGVQRGRIVASPTNLVQLEQSLWSSLSA